MDTAVLHQCCEASLQERITFGEVVGRLIEAGVERYHADLVRGETTYYMPDGSSHLVATKAFDTRPADAFSPDGVLAAVRSIQAGRTKYLTFCRQILERAASATSSRCRASAPSITAAAARPMSSRSPAADRLSASGEGDRRCPPGRNRRRG